MNRINPEVAVMEQMKVPILFGVDEQLTCEDEGEAVHYCLNTNQLDGRGDTLQIVIYPLSSRQMLLTDDSVIVNEMMMHGLDHEQMVRMLAKVDATGQIQLGDDLQLRLTVDDSLTLVAAARMQLQRTMLAILHQIGEL
jgi:hypothetical protein